MLALTRNPEKLEAKALQYEQNGKTAKAIKYREKALRLRQQQAQKSGVATTATPYTTSTTTTPVYSTGAPITTTATPTTTNNSFANAFPFMQRTPARYEQNALKWEQRGNWTKAQKNREKVWRLNNPQYSSSTAAPQFYQNNMFQGYNVPITGASTGGVPLSKAGQTVLPAVVETHVHNTIVEQTTRPQRIVEVQPVIHREIDQTQVRVVEKHVYETVPSAGNRTVTNAPIVQETLKPHIIEEVQPVVHRTVPAPFVEKVEQHVTEHIVQPTVMTKEIQQGGMVQSAPFVAAGGAPIQQTTTTTNTTTTQGGLMGKVQNALHHNRQ